MDKFETALSQTISKFSCELVYLRPWKVFGKLYNFLYKLGGGGGGGLKAVSHVFDWVIMTIARVGNLNGC